jgi:hypothetical protein
MVLLSQRRYIKDLLTHTHMSNVKSMLTPIPTSPPLMLNSSTPLCDPSKYRQVVVILQYLLIIRPDNAFTTLS